MKNIPDYMVNKKTVLFALAVGALTLNSCKENIDDSDLYTFTGQTITDYVKSDSSLTYFNRLLNEATMNSHSTSSIAALLSARGHYTCFAPTNEAVVSYLDSVYADLKGTSQEVTINNVPDTCARELVKNCVIDNGDEGTGYTTVDFPDGALGRTSMNDRYITTSFKAGSAGTEVYVNGRSKVLIKDVETVNGYVHVIDRVLSPSKASVADVISEAENGMVLFSNALELTGWDKKLQAFKDEEYEDWALEHPSITTPHLTNDKKKLPEKHNAGFTLFVEPDSVLQLYGITNVEQLAQKAKEWYPNATDPNPMSENNALNQFVSYHLVKGAMPDNKMVIHYSERNYSFLTPNASFTINVWDYYETMGKQRRLLKITEGPFTRDAKSGSYLRINRHSTYNRKNYNEIQDESMPGLVIYKKNVVNALNGFVYPISDVLLYTNEVADKVLNERMRYDITSLLPELITNCTRRPMSGEDNSYVLFPKYNGKDYLENLTANNDNTYIVYLPGYNSGSNGSWLNLQGDEFNCGGQYDLTLRLPPVPKEGTYEIRYACNINGNRSMAQIYFGTNKNNLPAQGIPLDLRVGGTAYGWKQDASFTEEDDIDENDRMLRNNGYMKGPKYFNPGKDASYTGRDNANCMRRIVYTGYMKPEETYYIRFKSVLENSGAEFVLDYIELVPKSIYNSTEEAEDKW